MTRQLSELAGTDFLVNTAGPPAYRCFHRRSGSLLREPDGKFQLRFGGETSIAGQNINASVAQWVADNDHAAGLGTDTLPNATAFFVPMVGSQRTIGVLGVRPSDAERLPRSRRAATTRNLRQPDCPLDRARSVAARREPGPSASRSRATAQFAPQFRLARFAHCRWQPSLARRRASSKLRHRKLGHLLSRSPTNRYAWLV